MSEKCHVKPHKASLNYPELQSGKKTFARKLRVVSRKITTSFRCADRGLAKCAAYLLKYPLHLHALTVD